MSSPLVSEQEDWFASARLHRAYGRAQQPLLYYIVEQVEKRGMPSEIALLRYRERLQPVAYSRAHASASGSSFRRPASSTGCSRNFWYDGRRDVMAATPQRSIILKALRMFGSWTLRSLPITGAKRRSRAIAKTSPKASRRTTAALTCRPRPATTCQTAGHKKTSSQSAQYGIDLAKCRTSRTSSPSPHNTST